MSFYSTQVQTPHFNAATGSFEALVVLHEGLDRYSVPCSLKLPIDTPFETVSRALVAQAKAERRNGAQHLVSRAKTAGRKTARPDLAALANGLLRSLNSPGQRHAA